MAFRPDQYQLIIWPRRISKTQLYTAFQSFVEHAPARFQHWQPAKVQIKRKRMFTKGLLVTTQFNQTPISSGGVGPVAPVGEFAQWSPDSVIRIEPKRANIRIRAPMTPKFGTKTRPC